MFTLFVRHPRARDLLVLLAICVFTLFATWPLARDIHRGVVSDLGDPLENAWILAWGSHALKEDPMGIFDANIFHPANDTLAFAESMIGLTIFVAPFFWVTNDALLTINATLLLLFVAGAYAIYLLLRELKVPRLAAFPVSLAFSLSPVRLNTVNHPHVLAVHILVLTLVLLIRFRRTGKKKYIFYLGVIGALQLWTSFTTAILVLIPLLVWLVVETLVDRRRVVRLLPGLMVAAALSLALSFPVLSTYLSVGRTYSAFDFSEANLVEFSALPSAYLTPGAGGSLLGPVYEAMRERFRDPVNWGEKHLFPGFWLSGGFLVAVGFGGLTLWRRRGTLRRSELATGTFLSLGTVALGLLASLGPRLGGAAGVSLPMLAIVGLVGRSPIRVPARFGHIVLLGVALMVGLWLGQLKGRILTVAAVFSLVLLSLELMPQRLGILYPPAIGSAHRALAEADVPGAVLALPTAELDENGNMMPDSIVREALQMYYSTGHFRPMANGYAQFWPPEYEVIVSDVQDFPSNRAFKTLRDYDVTIVILDTALAKDTVWEGAEVELDEWPNVRLVAFDKDVRVYDIARAR